MQPWIKRTALAAGVLAAVITGSLGAAVLVSDSKMQRTVHIPSHPIALKNDADSIARGRYLYQTKGCADCHGNDGGGHLFVDDPETGMRVSGANISGSSQSRVFRYQADDWDRTIRHGVKPDGTPLIFMPSEDFARLSDPDLEDLVAYVRQLPAVNTQPAQWQLPLPVRVLYALGVVQDSAEKIDHSLPPQPAIAAAVTAEYGEYLAQSCKGCHGPQLTGGVIPGAPPAWPAAANLTPGEQSALMHYPDEESFRAMFRSGRRPDGNAVSNVMPFAALGQMNDTDSAALFLYLKTLPPVVASNR